MIEIARLIEKGVRAGIEESLSILGIGKVAEDYDFGLRPRDLYGFQHIDPVTVGHPQIQNHDIGAQSLDALRRFPYVGRMADHFQLPDLLEQIRQALDHLG